MENSYTKLFVIYHTPSEDVSSDIYQSICVGNKKDSFPSNYIRDDKGDNIASKNYFYNEMTAIYWVYKHMNEFMVSDHFGFVHYRRFFVFSSIKQRALAKKGINRSLIFTNNYFLSNIYKEYDFIAPYPNHYKSVRHHYEKSHNDKDLPILINIIKEKENEYLEAANKYLDGQDEYSYNMFVFKRGDFAEYGRFVFNVLEEFEKEMGDSNRLYVSERLTGIFITYLLMKGYKAKYLPILHIRKKSLKGIKTNKKDRGLFYRFKNLILFLMPRWFEQYLRNKKAR